MDRYADLDLDCEDGGLAQKATLFGGLFKKSSKSAGPVARAQDSTQDSSSVGGGRSESSDGPTDGSKQKSAVFGGLLKRSPKAGHVRRPSQDLLDTEFTASDDSLSESATAKEKRAAFKGMFKASKPFGARTRSQEELSAPSEASSSNDSLSVNSNTKVTEGHVSGDDDDDDDNSLIRKDEEDTETLEKNEKKGEENPKPETKTMSTHATVRAGEAVDNQNQPQDKGLKEEDEGKLPESKSAKSDDEGLEEEEDASSKEEKEEEDGQDKTETQVKKPKRPNPFMPRAKGRVVHRSALEAAAESDGGNRSLFDRLEDFRVDPSQPEDRQDVENLMEWWNQVDSWKDTAQDDDMTEKEEAKAFAVTAEKVQKGIRVFNKLFSERAESLWQHVIDLNSIADGLDKFNKNTKIAQITGGSTSALGGVATITGLALAPVTFGVSLIVTAVGLGVATAGGLTSAGAGISNQVNNSMDRKKVEKIVQDYQEKMVDLDKCLKFIKQGIEDLKRFDLIKMKKRAYNRDFPALSSSFYEDGAMAGKAILSNANEIMRVVQIANAAGSTAARAVQIASMATGVLTGLFVGMDIYFVAKDSKELKKGAKSEFAAKIREVATELHDGLVELNGIRGELQSTSPEGRRGGPAAPETEDEGDESSEDEIDRIKRAIKKDYENREYV